MDQSLVHTFSWGNSCGPKVLKVFLKFPPTLVLVHCPWMALPSNTDHGTEHVKTEHVQSARHFPGMFRETFRGEPLKPQ